MVSVLRCITPLVRFFSHCQRASFHGSFLKAVTTPEHHNSTEVDRKGYTLMRLWCPGPPISCGTYRLLLLLPTCSIVHLYIVLFQSVFRSRRFKRTEHLSAAIEQSDDRARDQTRADRVRLSAYLCVSVGYLRV